MSSPLYGLLRKNVSMAEVPALRAKTPPLSGGRSLREHRHDVRARLPASKEVREHAHVRIDVREVRLQACTEVVQACFAIRGVEDPVLRALAMAGEQVLALTAVLRQ